MDPGFFCPAIVDSSNWIGGGGTVGETFSVTQNSQGIQVHRTDTGDTDAGWAMDLRFQCCGSGSDAYCGQIPASGTTCLSCIAGQHDSDSDAATVCTDCPSGRYSDAIAVTECSGVCPDGTHSFPASTHEGNCELCIPGRSDDDTDPGTPCDECEAGLFANTSGTLQCAFCPAGTHSGTVGLLEPGTCGSVVDLRDLTSPYYGSTSGGSNSYTTSCGGNGNDIIFGMLLEPGGSINIGMAETSYDSRHETRWGGTCPGANVVACTDDPDTQRHEWTNDQSEPQAVFFVVDAAGTGSGGVIVTWRTAGPAVRPCAGGEVTLTDSGTIDFFDSGPALGPECSGANGNRGYSDSNCAYWANNYGCDAITRHWHRTRCGTYCGVCVPPGYGNDEDCRWTLVCSNGLPATVFFSRFETEAGSDFVNVFDGGSPSAPLLAQLDGTSLPAPVVSGARGTVLVQFTSDGSTTAAGFHATLTCAGYPIDSSCSTHGGSAPEGTACAFPFNHSGEVHRQCSGDDNRVPWCYTNVTANHSNSATCARYTHFKFNLDPAGSNTGLRDWGAANSIQLAELDFFSVDGHVLTVDSAANPNGINPVGREATNAVNGAEELYNCATNATGSLESCANHKWRDLNKGDLIATFQVPTTVGSYNWMTANDHPERDPTL